MGSHNSSRTRVAPVFDHLFDLDPTGRIWLARLLRLGSRSDTIELPQDPGDLSANQPRWWGANERRLLPPVALLEWLINHITVEDIARSKDQGEVLSKRSLLAQRDASTVTEALSLIHGPEDGRRWYRFEGPSYPDVCIETNLLVLVVEGKRTERSCTSNTKWMGRRSQLLRHMDAALEVSGGRRVLGLLVVEGEKDASGGRFASSYWLAQSEAQIEIGMLRDSLPHRTPTERSLLASGVLGVATWQRVCSTFSLPWPPVPDVA